MVMLAAIAAAATREVLGIIMIGESLLLVNGVATERLAQENMPVGLMVLIHILLKSLRNL
jgi:hypothetical protein